MPLKTMRKSFIVVHSWSGETVKEIVVTDKDTWEQDLMFKKLLRTLDHDVYHLEVKMTNLEKTDS